MRFASLLALLLLSDAVRVEEQSREYGTLERCPGENLDSVRKFDFGNVNLFWSQGSEGWIIHAGIVGPSLGYVALGPSEHNDTLKGAELGVLTVGDDAQRQGLSVARVSRDMTKVAFLQIGEDGSTNRTSSSLFRNVSSWSGGSLAMLCVTIDFQCEETIRNQSWWLAYRVGDKSDEVLVSSVEEGFISLDFSEESNRRRKTPAPPWVETTQFQWRMILHGVFMSLAFIVFFPSGILISRYMKHRDPWWFQVHRGLGMGGILSLCAGLAITVEANWHKPLSGPTTLASVHKYVGLALFGLTVLQPLNAAFSPYKDSVSKTWTRFFWEQCHKSGGYLALFASPAVIAIGIFVLHESSLISSFLQTCWFVFLACGWIAGIGFCLFREYSTDTIRVK